MSSMKFKIMKRKMESLKPRSVDLAFEKIEHSIQGFCSQLQVVGGWKIMSIRIHYGANVVENR
jgi:hypothetical protein